MNKAIDELDSGLKAQLASLTGCGDQLLLLR